MAERGLLRPDLLFYFVERTWGREMLVQGELPYHSAEQARLMKPTSVKFEELAMIWPEMDLVRKLRAVYQVGGRIPIAQALGLAGGGAIAGVIGFTGVLVSFGFE